MLIIQGIMTQLVLIVLIRRLKTSVYCVLCNLKREVLSVLSPIDGDSIQVGRCPECGAAIGGSRHRLRDDNTTFTEMDGSRREDYQWMGHRN